MKIVVYGAGGEVGSRVVSEALSRGHAVTAVVRRQTQFAKLPSGARPKAADATDPFEIGREMAGHDLAISALRPPEGQEPTLVPLTKAVLEGAAAARTRVLIVGGAASLKMPDGSGETVLTAPGFLPPQVIPIAEASFAQYELCKSHTAANWTYLCPPALLTPGRRHGIYRTGSDTLLCDRDGQSRISMEDFAVALVDEAERPMHIGERFTVAY